MPAFSFTRSLKLAAAGLPLALAAAAATPAAAATYFSTVVASGLNNPRGLAFGPDGGLYIAESGFNDTGLLPGLPGVYGFSSTGSITQVLGGVQTRVITGLPSIYGSQLNEITGPSDIVFGPGGTGYVVIGLGADPAVRPGGSLLGHVLTFNLNGSFSAFADVSAFEAANNPDGGPLDSNPFHLAFGPDGLLVTDAGANALLSIASDGTVGLVGVFPDRPIGPPVPFSNTVPTGVAVAPDGTIYVAELTGFPFTAGAARIYSLAPGESDFTIFAEGLTNLTDIAIGADGQLYALSLDVDGYGPFGGPGTTGGIFRVSAGGAIENIFSTGLFAPTGLTIGGDGAFYVTTFSQGAAGAGQVLRVAAIPEPATWAMMLLGFGAVGLTVRRRQHGARRLLPA